MNTIKYYLSLFLSLIVLVTPVGGFGIILYMKDTTGLIVGAMVVEIGLMLNKPVQSLRIKYRNNVEYDEFGRSKSKGKYENLSKKERDEIDLQKTLDMERVMSSAAIKKMTKEGSRDPQRDMDNLVGLVPVKQKMKEMVARMEFDSKNKVKENNMSGRHMVFYGSPGTGKTTVARIITGFLYKYGYIKKNKCIEVDGNTLKAGQDTATKTELIIREAYGGVLFIDEAYALMDSYDSSGKEAIATLIKQMEDNRDKFILILAGYTNDMRVLLNSNPGFESRIKEYLDFPDYNSQEMREIFIKMANANNFVVDEEALIAFDERITKERTLSSFGNGRTARNILNEAIDKHALNYMKGIISKENKFKLCKQDISTKLKRKNFV